MATLNSIEGSWTVDPRTRRRIGAGATTLLIEGLIGYLLVTGSVAALRPVAREEIKTFAIDRTAPHERVMPRPAHSKRPEGAASPPNLRATASEIVAPPPVVPLIVPPPIIAAPVAGIGRDASAGASDVRGPGTGSGGIGNGTGSGGAGDGDGDGGEETAPRWRKGRLKDSDYPRGAGDAGVGGTVEVLYLVGVDGRVSDCKVAHSSGNAELDAVTCRLIVERFRYDPSRDASGHAVPSYIRENHSWAIREDPTAPR